MANDMPLADEINRGFGGDRLPAPFQRLAANEPYLATAWRRYQSVMPGGEIERSVKELMGLSVAVAKSNEYMIGLQLRRLTKELIAAAVSAVNACFY
jgi:alkylhydroperoxidase/carboxymuconolactone decarboxylase family protein YurZ